MNPNPETFVWLFSYGLQLGGSESIIQALVRGLEKHGGKLLLRAHADELLMEKGRASGIVLQQRQKGKGNTAAAAAGGAAGGGGVVAGAGGSGGRREVIRARKGVISNASVWDTLKLLPQGVGPKQWRETCRTTPQVGAKIQGLVGSSGFSRGGGNGWGQA